MNQVGFGALLPLLLVLTSGWGLLQSHYGKTFVWWQSGYNLYFRIAFAGLLCFFFTIILVVAFAPLGFLLEFPCTGGDDAFVSSLLQCRNEILFIAAWMTPVLGLSGYILANVIWQADSQSIEKKHKVIIQGKELEGYIKRTLEKHPFLSITLDNRKVYVGIVSNTFHFNELDKEEKYLRLKVNFSGYRGDADLQFRISVGYMNEKPQTGGENLGSEASLMEGQEIIVPVRKVVSIQPFDPEVYAKYAEKFPRMQQAHVQ